MNNHQRRLLTGFIIAVLVLTALFLILPKTPLVITAYCFSLLAPVMFFGMLLLVTTSTKKQYITNAAFPLQASTYAGLNISICVLIVLLAHFEIWTMAPKWFALVHILLIAFFAWRVLAMDSGREKIEQVGGTAQQKVQNWKMIGAEVETLKNNAPESCRKALQDVIDAIRYADPMSTPDLEPLDDAIRENVCQLGTNLKEKKPEDVQAICSAIQKQVKDRSARAKLLKQ